MGLARKLRFVPAILIGAGLIWLFTHDGDGGGGSVNPPSRRKMLDMSFPGLDGGTWTLSNERGKVVLVNFWATWCGPCREETPALVRIANDYRGRGLAVIGVSLDDGGPGRVHQFVNTYQVPYPILFPGPDAPVASSIESIPTTLLVDRQGRVARTYVGAERGSTFRRDIDALLQESP